MKDLCRRLFAKVKSPTFLFYVLAVGVMTAQMVIASYAMCDFYTPSIRGLSRIHLLDVIFLSAFYWILPSRYKGWIWLLITIVTIWCFAHIIYNETYRDMMPFSSWLYVSNLGNVLFDSILGTINSEAVAVLTLPIVLLAIYLPWFRKNVSRDKSFSCNRILIGFIVFLFPVITHLSFSLVGYLRSNSNSFMAHLANKYYNTVNFKNKVYMINNGTVPFVIYSICMACENITDEQKQQAQQFINKEIPAYSDNPYCSVPSRNMVLLLVESLNAWVVDLKIDGQEVCPVLNSLLADTASIACTQMMAQVKNGRSSDGMFIYNTGLLPLTGGSVAMDFGDNDYPSLSKALKSVNPKYSTMEITVDRAGMWNVETTARSYGFDSLYLQDVYRDTYIKSGQSIDKTLLEYSSNKLAVSTTPFFAMIFTGTTHIPYDKLEDVEPTWISQSKSYTVNVRNYLEKVAFFDRQLGAFIDRLKHDGTYDNTVLVIASDHSDFVDDDPQGRASISKRGIECMFVVLNSGLKGQRISGPVAQVDLYPTLLDIMGANTYWWKGLGHSLLRNNVTSATPAPGETVGNSKLLNHQKQAWVVSNTLIKTNWWEKK